MKIEIKFRAWNLDDSDSMFDPFESGIRFETFINAPSIILMQYTGLKDKNGKDIYEGDIIFSPSWWWGPGEVFLDIGRCGPCEGDSVMSYLCRNKKNGTSHNIWNGKEVEVVGNIHETPELLK